MGAAPHGFQTTDGGKTWTKADLGKATNKIRLLKTDSGFVGYAIGVDIYKLEVPLAGEARAPASAPAQHIAH